MTFVDALATLESDASAGIYTGYLPRPIPHALDLRPEEVVKGYESATPGERELLACMNEPVPQVLLAYAERMTSLAVRQGDGRANDLALTALAISGTCRSETRETLLVMPLCWRSAEILGVDPQAQFKRVAAQVPESARAQLLSFAARTPSNRSLDAMGYIESRDADGFRYERTW